MSLVENIFFFCLFGVVGVSAEVFFNAVVNLRKKKDFTLKGDSSLWMFFICGFIYFIVLFVTANFMHYPILFRGLIYMFMISYVEFCSGAVLKIFNALPWDYSKDRKFHFQGIVCLEFILFWFVYGILAETAYLFIKAHLNF